jgi:type IV pilus assembly protein PilA
LIAPVGDFDSGVRSSLQRLARRVDECHVLSGLSRDTQDEGGFTLIELLVVVLIVGILSAIAIPAFLSQKSKADDAGAKTQVGTMQTAMETYATNNDGSYKGASIAELQKIEPTLNDKSTAIPLKAEGSATGYTIESEAVGTKDTFTLVNNAGAVERTCVAVNKENTGGCPKGKW